MSNLWCLGSWALPTVDSNDDGRQSATSRFNSDQSNRFARSSPKPSHLITALSLQLQPRLLGDLPIDRRQTKKTTPSIRSFSGPNIRGVALPKRRHGEIHSWGRTTASLGWRAWNGSHCFEIALVAAEKKKRPFGIRNSGLEKTGG